MTRDDASDLDLIRSFRDGDGDALWELCRRHERALSDRIRRRVPQRLRRRVSVADVLQDVRLGAYESREACDASDDDGFRRWLLGIADHKALQAARHHGETAKRAADREVTRAARPVTAELRSRSPTPSQIAVAAELSQMARDAMTALSPDHQAVLRLARDQRLPLREVAARMERSYDATKKLYARALAAFGAELRRRRGDSLA